MSSYANFYFKSDLDELRLPRSLPECTDILEWELLFDFLLDDVSPGLELRLLLLALLLP